MGRADRRVKDRQSQKLKKEVNKLTPNQLKLVDAITEHKANVLIDTFKGLIDDAVFNALRNNRVGEERANKIMLEANQNIKDLLKEEKE